MRSEVISGRYAEALLAAAIEQNAAEAVLEQIKWYQKTAAVSASPLLENPMIPTEEKEAMLSKIFPQNGDARLLFHFIRLLLRKGRVGYLSDIFRLYPKRYEAKIGIVKGTLYLAYPVSNDLIERLRAKIETKVGRRVVLDILQDRQILGGFIFATGTELIDASLKRLLLDLGERLKTVPVG